MTHQPNRPLGATEKLFWLLDQASQVHFVMAAEISGKIDEVSLQKALNSLLKCHPLLSCKIIANGYEHPYFEYVAGLTVPLRIVEQKLTYTIAGEIAKELSIPFDWTSAPLIRCVLISDTLNPVIIFAAHHSVSDGISMAFIIRDLLNALNGKDLADVAIPLSIDQLLGVAQTNPAPVVDSVYMDQPIPRLKHSQPNVYFEKIGLESANRILQKSKHEGTTFNGALYAASLSAAREASFPWSNGPIKVIVPVSLRNDLTEGESSCLYITSRALFSEYPEPVDFWKLAREAINEFNGEHDRNILTSNAINLHAGLFSGLSVSDLSNALQHGVVREMMLSNLGRIPYPTSFGNLTLKNIWGPVALSGTPHELTIGVTTVDAEIFLTMATRLDAPHFLHSVVAALENAASINH